MPKRSQSPDFFSNRNLLILLLIGVAGLARVLFLSAASETFLWDGIWSDSATYNQWARRIVVNNDWIGNAPFFMSPFYPYFLAGVYSVFGESLAAVRVIQAALGVATVLLIFFITERLFSRKAAFFAGLLAALYGPFLLSNFLLLVETLKVFFLVLTFWLLLLAKERKRILLWLAAGLTLGGAVLCRPTDLLIVPVVILWVISFHKSFPGSVAVPLLPFLAGVALLIAPVTIRNYAVSGEFIPITSNGGLNFYIGNNPKAVGVYYNVDQLDLANDPDGRVYLETEMGRTLRHSEVSSIWFSRALDYVTSHVFSSVGLLAKKTLLLFHYKEISQLGYNYVFVKDHAVPFLGWMPAFFLAGSLGLLGIIASLKRKKELFLIYGFLAAEAAGIVLFFVTDRFRLSLVPFLMIFSGFGVTRVLDLLKNPLPKGIVQTAGILAASFLLMMALNIDIPDEFSMEWEQVGMLYFNSRPPELVMRAGRGDGGAAQALNERYYQPALQAYRESARYKDSFHIRNNVGNVLVAMGRIGEGMKQYEAGHALNPSQAISTFSMGMAHVSRKEWDTALRYLDAAIEINPRFAPAHLNRGLVLYYQQRFDEALVALRRYTELERDESKLVTVRRDIHNLEELIRAQPSALPGP